VPVFHAGLRCMAHLAPWVGGVLGSRTHLGSRSDRVTAGRGTSPLMTRQSLER